MAHDPRDPDAAMFEGDDLVEPPRWPKVVGTISIVWAALGLTCAGCGLASIALMDQFIKPAEERFGPMPDVMKPGPAQIVLSVISFLPVIVLLVAGIMVVARKPLGGTLHLVYAVLSLIITGVAAVFGLQQQMAIAEWVRQNPDSQWAQQSNPTMGFVMMGLMVALGLAWPVFCLIWFGVVKRRAPMDIPREDII